MIPQIDKLKEQEIADIIRLMNECDIGNTIYYDLMATEFARKHRSD